MISLTLFVALALQTTQPAATAPADSPVTPAVSARSGTELAHKIMSASGIEVWPSVTRLRFTFNVAEGDKVVVSAKHDWDLRAGTDLVTIGEKTMTAYFPETLARVRLDEEAMKAHEQAWKRWTNDAYWLLMPLKLLDSGAKLSEVATTRDMPASVGSMTLSFDGVGLTPGDRYALTVDLKTNHITHWFYMPSTEKKLGFTWENYQPFNGLVLATEHKSDDGARRIYFTDIEVVRE